jgi:hypothetical protein
VVLCTVITPICHPRTLFRTYSGLGAGISTAEKALNTNEL